MGACRLPRPHLAPSHRQLVEREIHNNIQWPVFDLLTLPGVSSLGKASYVITLTPYFVLTALLVYAAPREV